MEKNKEFKQLNGREGGIYYAFTIALFVILSFIGQAIMGAIVDKTSTVYIAVCSTFSVITFFAVIAYAVFYVKVQPKSLVGEGFGVKFLPASLLLACGMFFGLGYVNEAIAKIFTDFGLNVSAINVPLTSPLHLIFFSVTLALLPAIAEELFFRGIVLNSLSKVKKVYAVLISALCFSLYHCSVTQLIYQFIYGVALGFLFLTAKSVLPCIVAHFVNNFTVLCMQYFNVQLNLFSIVYIAIGVACLAVFATVVFFVFRKRKEKEQSSQTEDGEISAFIVPYGLFAFLVCIALAVGSLVS